MSALYVMIALAYLNGDLVQIDAGKAYPDQGKCVEASKAAAEHFAPEIPAELQLVYKCMDISQVPNAVSVFGQAKSL